MVRFFFRSSSTSRKFLIVFAFLVRLRCDERFIGYGGNKAACLFELYLSGVSFYVLPDDFLIHQSHAYAEKARKHERKYNRKLYTDYREELCFRYLNLFLDEIDGTRARVRFLSFLSSVEFLSTSTNLFVLLYIYYPESCY